MAVADSVCLSECNVKVRALSFALVGGGGGGSLPWSDETIVRITSCSLACFKKPGEGNYCIKRKSESQPMNR